MDLELRGKRALVTGSTDGIGAAIAQSMASEGAAVVIHGRQMAHAHAVKQRIVCAGGQAEVVLAELNEFDSVEALARQARAAFGGIDILVNCAGAASTFDAWMDTPVQRWQQQFQLTTLYAVHLILSLVPDMRNAKWGRVINIGSDAAMRPRGFGPEYSAAKAALATIAVSLSDAVAADGITVNTVSSGVVLTRNTENVVLAHAQRLDPTSTVETVDQVAVRLWPSPSGKLGTPEDVASAVCYLASPRANHITGATLRVDGGMYGVVH